MCNITQVYAHCAFGTGLYISSYQIYTHKSLCIDSQNFFCSPMKAQDFIYSPVKAHHPCLCLLTHLHLSNFYTQIIFVNCVQYDFQGTGLYISSFEIYIHRLLCTDSQDVFCSPMKTQDLFCSLMKT